MSRRYLVAGNWKMNGSLQANRELVQGIAAGLGDCPGVEVMVCPPPVYLSQVQGLVQGTPIALGAQNLSDQAKPGAFTGEVHGAMLREMGCRYVLVGHSERRALYGETDAVVAAKFVTAQALELLPVLCLGETLDERDAGRTESVLQRQLDAVVERAGIDAFARAVIAYEPVWAIGTGRTASPEQAQEAHAFVRKVLTDMFGEDTAQKIRIQYGGSVKPGNMAELISQKDVDGALVGGASLEHGSFWEICRAAIDWVNAQ